MAENNYSKSRDNGIKDVGGSVEIRTFINVNIE